MLHDPLISVFTPSHNPRWLDEVHASLLSQTYQHWEWVVVLNGGAQWSPTVPDDRIRIASDDCIAGVGAAKRRACELAKGEILVELDHDDLLADDALECVALAFAVYPDSGLIFSRCAQITETGERDNSRFMADYGWEYIEDEVDGLAVQAVMPLEPTPHNVSLIWYAPNHLRAFTRAAYDAVGGYNPALTVLDDQDLMCRLYQYGEFRGINATLYLQRVHPGNTQSDVATNARIQQQTLAIYEQYIEANALAWAKRRGLLALDLGAAHSKAPGFLGVDMHSVDGVDIVATLPRLPLGDNSVGVIRAHDFMEHVTDKVALINEFYRVLAPGGMLLSLTPSTDGRGAFQDPTHVAFYNENSFWYYTDANYAAFVPEIEARFQTSRLVTMFPSDWHAENNISYVRANLIALKPGTPRNGGIVRFDC